MANEIDKVTVIQFSDDVHTRAQQIQSRLRPFVRIKQLRGKSYAYDGKGSIEAQELNGRFNPVIFSDLELTRRKIGRRRFSITLPIDGDDVNKILLNPDNEYAEACVMAMMRVFDRVGVEALFANVSTGEDFENTVTFAADGGLTVNATAGFTYEKLLEITQNFIDNDVGIENIETLLMGISGDEHTALMKETELTSGDFTRQFAIEKGRMIEALGMKMLLFAANATNPILSVAAGVRSNFAMSSRGLCYAMPKEFELKIQERSDIVDTRQVQINWTLGAVRTEGVLVQKVTSTD